MANSIFHMEKNLYYSAISFFQTQGPRVIRGKDKAILEILALWNRVCYSHHTYCALFILAVT